MVLTWRTRRSTQSIYSALSCFGFISFMTTTFWTIRGQLMMDSPSGLSLLFLDFIQRVITCNCPGTNHYIWNALILGGWKTFANRNTLTHHFKTFTNTETLAWPSFSVTFWRTKLENGVLLGGPIPSTFRTQWTPHRLRIHRPVANINNSSDKPHTALRGSQSSLVVFATSAISTLGTADDLLRQ